MGLDRRLGVDSRTRLRSGSSRRTEESVMPLYSDQEQIKSHVSC